MTKNLGKIVGINGNMVSVETDSQVSLNEVGYILLNEQRLKAEVIRITGKRLELQVFEATSGVSIGNSVEFSGELLTVELGPGLLTQIYDGLQNPLPELAEQCGFFLQRGIYLNALPRNIEWDFTPVLKAGDTVTITKDLEVKGAGFTAKRGTAVRNISLPQDDETHIEGRVNGTKIMILTKYLKKQ